MKLPSTISKLLENKNVLYIIVFLAVFNLLGYVITGKINSIILFILVAGAMRLFSKNMIIILTVPLLLTSGILVGNKVAENFIGSGREGMTDKEDDKKDRKEDRIEDRKYARKDDRKDDKIDARQDARQDKKRADKKQTNSSMNSVPITDASDTVPSEPMTLYKKKTNRIDYASTLEDAYGDLNNILGKDGIKNLTSDTQKLMDQQMQLADALKGMAPLIGDAKKMLQGIDISGLTNMAQKFN